MSVYHFIYYLLSGRPCHFLQSSYPGLPQSPYGPAAPQSTIYHGVPFRLRTTSLESSILNPDQCGWKSFDKSHLTTQIVGGNWRLRILIWRICAWDVPTMLMASLWRRIFIFFGFMQCCSILIVMDLFPLHHLLWYVALGCTTGVTWFNLFCRSANNYWQD